MPSKSGEHKVKIAPKGATYDKHYEEIFRKKEEVKKEGSPKP